MNRAPTTISVPPIRSQYGSGVKKRKNRKHKKGKTKRSRKRRTNVRGRNVGIGRLIRRILKA